MNPIAFQVHGGAGAFPNPRGTWYRNIRMRELDSLGRPLHKSVGVPERKPGAEAATDAGVLSRLRWTAQGLAGRIDAEHRLTIRDGRGRLLAAYSGSAGEAAYRLPASSEGILRVTLETPHGVERGKVIRLRR
jgi:hypothetical protein